jgi:hypothetical protein
MATAQRLSYRDGLFRHARLIITPRCQLCQAHCQNARTIVHARETLRTRVRSLLPTRVFIIADDSRTLPHSLTHSTALLSSWQVDPCLQPDGDHRGRWDHLDV